MSHRQDLERHRHSLGEVRNIMNSMKNLAFMETRKLSRFLDAQQAVVESIETVAADFIRHQPDILPAETDTTQVYIIIGTERGFCGDFNQAIVNHITRTLDAQSASQTRLVVVGRKMHSLLEKHAHIATFVDGPSVVEEVTTVLDQLVHKLSFLQQEHGVLSVFGLYHGGDDGIAMQKLLPPFQQPLQANEATAYPAELNLAPAEMLTGLTDQYLFASMHAMLYTSLMSENHYRVMHLEAAVNHLDDEAENLRRKYNAIRQEEIIEEIEVILLSADMQV